MQHFWTAKGKIISIRYFLLLHQKVIYTVNVQKFQTKVSDKMTYANRADPDQTAPEGAVWSGATLFAIPLNILSNKYIKSKIYVTIVWNKVFETLGHSPYVFACLLYIEE